MFHFQLTSHLSGLDEGSAVWPKRRSEPAAWRLVLGVAKKKNYWEITKKKGYYHKVHRSRPGMVLVEGTAAQLRKISKRFATLRHFLRKTRLVKSSGAIALAWVWQPSILSLICIESVAVWRGDNRLATLWHFLCKTGLKSSGPLALSMAACDFIPDLHRKCRSVARGLTAVPGPRFQ